MTPTLTLGASLVAGALLAAMFFGGLWWTVDRGLTSSRPGIWFLCSVTARTALVMAGFYVASLRPRAWLVPALVGFSIAGLLATCWAMRGPASARGR